MQKTPEFSGKDDQKFLEEKMEQMFAFGAAVWYNTKEDSVRIPIEEDQHGGIVHHAETDL